MTRENTTIEATQHDEEVDVEVSLRPDRFASFTGQRALKENLSVMVQSAQKRDASIDHVLFSGPPGLGKTTLGYILAKEMDVDIHVTSGPALERKGDLAGILTSLGAHDILFIDEIHRLNTVIEENLYPAMEDRYFDIVIGEGAHARSMKLSLPPFTLIGATTRSGLMSAPLRDRFGLVARLHYYESDELADIVERSAEILDIGISRDGAEEIAKRSRGTPRIANRLLRRVRDYAVVSDQTSIDSELADFALKKLNVDHRGFDVLDRMYLDALIKKFNGGPVGIDTIASAIGEEKDTLEEVVEPYFLQQGFIQRTPRGRIATKHAYAHLNVAVPASKQESLL